MTHAALKDLLPCPFCGCATRIQSNWDWHRLTGDHDETCMFVDTDAVMTVPATDECLLEMVAAWNRRAALSAMEGGGCWIGTITDEKGGAIDWRGGVHALYRDFAPGTKLYAYTAPPPQQAAPVRDAQWLEDAAEDVAGMASWQERLNKWKRLAVQWPGWFDRADIDVGGKALRLTWVEAQIVDGIIARIHEDFGMDSLATQPQQAGGEREQAPPNSLPSWSECALRVDNSAYVAKRQAEGGYGEEPDGLYANELHRFIYEYDDADPYRSAWFMHRLEKLIEFVSTPPQPEAGGGVTELRAEVERLNAIINTPQADDFLRAVSTEAEHQRQRWGNDHDSGKAPADWFWLIGYLAGKALHATMYGLDEKAEHHVITTAAACANWHKAMRGQTNMRPGIDGDAALSTTTASGGEHG